MATRRDANRSTDVFALLPLELLSNIYISSANPHLPFVSRHLYQTLSGHGTRILFCVNIFDRSYDWGLDVPRLDIAQTEVVSRRWFDRAFGIEVEHEVALRMKGTPPTNPDAHEVASMLKASRNNPVEFRRMPQTSPCVHVGARLPLHLLRAPWTDEKLDHLFRLLGWGLRANWSFDRRYFPGLIEAVDHAYPTLVQIFLEHEVKATVDGEIMLHALESGLESQMARSLISTYVREKAPKDPAKQQDIRRTLRDRIKEMIDCEKGIISGEASKGELKRRKRRLRELQSLLKLVQ